MLNPCFYGIICMDYHYAKKRDPKVGEYFDKETMDAWVKWDELVFKPGKLDKKTKELIAVACTYMTRCPYCIEGHAKAAIKAGASKKNCRGHTDRHGVEQRRSNRSP